MGIFARSQEIDAEVLQKIDWQWLETRCSPTELSSGLMMAWSQELSDGSNLIARVIRSAPKGTHASWSIRAIVVDAITYSELIDRMEHCLSDDNFGTANASLTALRHSCQTGIGMMRFQPTILLS